MSNIQIPDVEIDDSFLSEMLAPDMVLRGGWYRALVSKVVPKISTKNDDAGYPKLTYMLQLHLNMLKDENKITSVDKKARERKLLCFPFNHPDLVAPVNAEHAATRRTAKTAILKSMINDLRALLGVDIVPKQAEYENGRLMFKGEEIAEEEREEANRELKSLGLKIGKDTWSNPDSLLDSAPYIKYDPTQSFPVVDMKDELPPEAQLVPPSKWWIESPSV